MGSKDIILAILATCLVVANANEVLNQKLYDNDCKTDIMGEKWDSSKASCVMVCTGVKEGWLNEDFSINLKANEAHINKMDLSQDIKDSFIKAATPCEKVGVVSDRCESGNKMYKCLKENGAIFKKNSSH